MRVMPESWLAAVIAANVRAERNRRHWRQADLGDRIGWSISQVSALETGGRDVHANDLPLLCRALDIPLTDLLTHAGRDDLNALQVR
jgi:transcriptional regulator with XRE-family HTH domain